MSEEPRRYADPAGVPDQESPMTLDEIVDRAGRRVSTALIVAGAMVGLAIYWQPPPPRYQMAVSGNQVLRIDTRKGTILGCEGGRCTTVLRHGDHLSPRVTVNVGDQVSAKLPSPPAAAPAPATAPAPTPSTAPAGH